MDGYTLQSPEKCAKPVAGLSTHLGILLVYEAKHAKVTAKNDLLEVEFIKEAEIQEMLRATLNGPRTRCDQPSAILFQPTEKGAKLRAKPERKKEYPGIKGVGQLTPTFPFRSLAQQVS